LAYMAFRMVNAEPGGGKPSPYTFLSCVLFLTPNTGGFHVGVTVDSQIQATPQSKKVTICLLSAL